MRLDADLLYGAGHSFPVGVLRPEFGDYFAGWKPVDIEPFSEVALSAVDGSFESVLFRGWITGWRPGKGESAELIAHDARWRMSRMFVHGFAFYEEGGVGAQGRFVRPAETIFNRRNQPDLLLNYDGSYPVYANEPRFLFSRPYFNSYDGWLPQGSGCFAAWWNAMDIYGYLWQLFQTSLGFGATANMPAVDDWLVLPKPTNTVLATKIADAVPSEVTLTGMTMAEALDKICDLAGDVSWTIEPEADPDADEKQRLVFYDSKLGVGAASFARGAVGANIKNSTPTVGAVKVFRNYQGVANRVVALGGKRRVMLTFSTADGSLVQGWTAAEATAWLAQAADEKRNSAQYPNAFLRWVVPYTFNWAGKTAETYAQKRSRKLLPLLMEKWFAAPSQGAGPRELPAQIWRYFGSTWELLPDPISARVLPDEGGFLLSGNARSLEAGEPWSWDESAETPYPMRITAVVECDEHLLSENDFTGPFRLDQFIHVPGRIKETANGAKVHVTGEGDGSEVTRTKTYSDDTDSLASTAVKVARLVNHPRAGGTLEWDYICRAVKVGMMVDTLTGGGATRPNILLQGVINGLTYEFNSRQHTTAEIEAL
jgi:hypothetical protein